jgi:hypothetical protein
MNLKPFGTYIIVVLGPVDKRVSVDKVNNLQHLIYEHLRGYTMEDYNMYCGTLKGENLDQLIEDWMNLEVKEDEERKAKGRIQP